MYTRGFYSGSKKIPPKPVHSITFYKAIDLNVYEISFRFQWL